MRPTGRRSNTRCVAVAAALLYPLPAILLLGRRIKRIGPAYILIQVIHAILSVLVMAAEGTNAVKDVTLAGLFPGATFVFTLTEENNWEQAVILLTALTCAGLVVLLVKAHANWETLRPQSPAEPSRG